MRENKLMTIAESYFIKEEIKTIERISSLPSLSRVLEFDRGLGGIGLFNINIGRTGRYHVEDRGILRPLQYIYMHLENHADSLSWYTRDIVHMSGLHLESIIKRFTGNYRVPLGKSLHNKKIKKAMDGKLLAELDVIAQMYNAVKHEMSQYKDEHLFSIGDALLCYFVTRKLASQLYPHIKLYTASEVWKD